MEEEAMGRRPWQAHNVQDRAFTLFNKGRSIFFVAEALDITIAEARRHYKVFQQGDEISARHRESVRQEIERQWAAERDEAVADLAARLDRNRSFQALMKRVQDR